MTLHKRVDSVPPASCNRRATSPSLAIMMFVRRWLEREARDEHCSGFFNPATIPTVTCAGIAMERADLFGQYLDLQAQGVSERQTAKQLQVPRTPLQGWRKWHETLDICPEMAQFFQSGPGLAFLHRLVLALHLVCVEVGACGIRLVCLFTQPDRSGPVCRRVLWCPAAGQPPAWNRRWLTTTESTPRA